MKTIKEYLQSIKQERRDVIATSLRQSFDVAERDGHLWLTHDGVAFYKFNPIASAGEVAATLNNARSCATEFEGL